MSTSLPEGTIVHVTVNGEAMLPAGAGNCGIATFVFQDVTPGTQRVCVDERLDICESLDCL